jgi:hypothetical protein
VNNCDLKLLLCDIDNGRFKNLVQVLKISNVCSKCGSFNLSVQDPQQRYLCCVMGPCIAATLHPHLVSYLNWQLGWIDDKTHTSNLGLPLRP